jgi:hypothetical protein
MDDVTRRDALVRIAAAAGTASLLTPGATSGAAAQRPDQDDAHWSVERRKVVAAGMTEDEAECWVLAGKVAGKFFALPKLHDMDEHEIAHAVHVIQYRLLSRPTYRRYKEISKVTPQK